MVNVFAICDNNCKHPTYTQEQFLALLEQLLNSGSLEGINPDLPTVEKIKEIRAGNAIQFWTGTEAQFNELGITADSYTNVIFRVGTDGKIYICTNDTTLAGIKQEIKNSLKSTLAATTITTWAETVTYSNEAISATSPVELLPGDNITAEQLKALQKANIVHGGQTAGQITLKLLGTVPAIEIPVKFIIRKDM